MTKSRFLFFLVSTLLVLPILAGSFVGATADEDRGEDSLYKYLSLFTDSLGLVEQAYVEETDVDALMAAALDGITDALDPLAVYVPEEAVPGYLEARAAGSSLSGLVLLRERGMIYVLAVQPGSPADEAGFKTGDLIAELQGRSTRVMPLWEIQEILGSEAGTEIDVQLVRYADTMDVSLILAPFEPPVPTVEEHDGVPVLSIPGFEAGTSARIEELIGGLGERDELVIDVRGAARGDAEAAYEAAGLFAEGELGRLTERGGEPVESWFGEEPARWDGRILVLTGRSTFGPAEVFVSVLRQKVDAEVVGGRTFGHAGRQSMFELSSGAVLFLADGFYTGPDFEPLDEPLEPDVRVAERLRTFEDEEDRDEAAPDAVLDRALEILSEAAPEEDEEKVAA